MTTMVAPRPALVTPALLVRFVSMVGASASFYLLLSVVPVYAGPRAAGLVTGALMLATVGGELATPRLVARYGYRRVLAVGLLLLGLPALVLLAPVGLAGVVAVCAVRGLGFAFTVVAGGALTASLIPAARRGEGLALCGVVNGVPSIVALPLGLWLAAHSGSGPVYAVGAAASLVALVSVPWLPDRERPAIVGARAVSGGAVSGGAVSGGAVSGGAVSGGAVSGGAVSGGVASGRGGGGSGVVAGLRAGAIVRPALVFAATTMAAGVLVTFLPLAVTGAAGGVAAPALLAQTATSTLTRWLAGRHGDRHGPARLVVPGLLLSAVGMLVLAFTGSPVAVLGGAVVFGAGFGVAQNATLALMYSRVQAERYGVVSAVWNIAYDAGLGLGAVGFGALAGPVGYPTAFVLTAALMLLGLRAAKERPDHRLAK